jgi:hypothetical protein
MPFLSWRYVNGHGKPIPRNNTDDFCKAADAMCMFMQRYRSVPETGLPGRDANKIRSLLVEVLEEKGEKRHKTWLEEIRKGNFSFGPADVSYDDKDRASWKASALGTSFDLPVHDYRDEFLDSDWKMFHDALQQHRLTILHEILPKYGICAA